MNTKSQILNILASRSHRAAAERELRRAQKARALANKQRDILARMAVEGDPRATLEVVGRAAVRAILAEASVSKSRDYFLSFIKA